MSNTGFTMGNSDREDTVYCLHADTEETVWSYSYPYVLGQYPGPRTTPSVDGDRVYTLSREGDEQYSSVPIASTWSMRTPGR